ncbi:MAG: peptidoglycan-binding protein, partial [Sulfurovaceae bacterium]|nr:peptidoglycan-binding protein [Sulfurovaceae bacterium]
ITKKKKIAPGYAKWVPIVCKSSINSTMITQVQQALKSAGYYRGSIDGVWGSESQSAVRAYQKAKGLPVAGLSMATMESLGVY